MFYTQPDPVPAPFARTERSTQRRRGLDVTTYAGVDVRTSSHRVYMCMYITTHKAMQQGYISLELGLLLQPTKALSRILGVYIHCTLLQCTLRTAVRTKVSSVENPGVVYACVLISSFIFFVECGGSVCLPVTRPHYIYDGTELYEPAVWGSGAPLIPQSSSRSTL